MLIDTRKSPWAKAHSIPQEAVNWKDGFWKERFDVCVTNMVGHIRNLFEDNRSIFHVVENFRVAAKIHQGDHEGTSFGDGDFYKWMEAALYAAVKGKDKKLEEDLEEYVALIGKCQQEDGYLSTKQIISEMKGIKDSRNKDINEFEVYNFGHMFTAACTYKRLTGKDSFLVIVEKAADYLAKMYEDAAKKGIVQTAVCPSHYMGLVELYRTTGEKKYLVLAERCINLRDAVKDGTDDNQDRLPLREHRKIAGHGVRSTYLYAGVADLYAETGEAALLEALNSCWDNMVHQKMYITGGIGALYQGVSPLWDFLHGAKMHQAFGYEYQLPNITAYNETCAALGSIFWNQRMFAIQPEAAYFDIIERTMLNLALAAVSLDGKKYFYENMLRRTRALDYKLTWPLEREDKLTCYCCPSNLVRVIASSAEYAYMVSGRGIYCGLYGASEAEFDLEDGGAFTLVQETEYPWNGKIIFTCKNIRRKDPFTLHLRIPGWLEEGSVSVNGKPLQPLCAKDANSFVSIPVDDPETAKIEARFDMQARLTIAHPKVEEDVNQAAVERGPLVYCVESPDAELETLDDLLLPGDADFEEIPWEIDGQKITALKTEGIVLEREGYDRNALYQKFSVKGKKKIPFTLIPYFAWDNRGFGEMRIWLPLYLGG